jgi:hypothetical protein
LAGNGPQNYTNFSHTILGFTLMAYEVQVSFVEYLGAFLPVSDDIGRAEKQP